MGGEVWPEFGQADPPMFSGPGDKWHLDEGATGIAGRRHWLWRAVDRHGVMLDILVQSHRAAKAAKRETMPGVGYRQHRSLNNRTEKVAQ